MCVCAIKAWELLPARARAVLLAGQSGLLQPLGSGAAVAFGAARQGPGAHWIQPGMLRGKAEGKAGPAGSSSGRPGLGLW